MAEFLTQLVSEMILAQAGVSENATAAGEAAAGAEAVKEKYKATPYGMLTAYTSILIMSVVPIFFGSFKSASKVGKDGEEGSSESGEHPDTMTTKDAMMFPVIASGALLTLYIVFRVFGKDHINMLLTFYFFLIGVIALGHVLAPILRSFISHDLVRNETYNISLDCITNSPAVNVTEFQFDHFNLIAMATSILVGVWYIFKKHWIANNLFGLAFAHNGIELLHLNSVGTGCILLGGLFIYDVFWVFGTDVMVTVAKSFEAPIKLVFPQDFLESGFYGRHHAMLGLGDIVIPGIFIALLLRYDLSKGPSASKIYFTVSFIAYVLGLILTVVIMTVFKHAQPALLYLVPACVGSPLLVALILGEIKPLFQYRDSPEEEEVEEKGANATAKTSAEDDKQTQSPATTVNSNNRSTRSKAKKDM